MSFPTLPTLQLSIRSAASSSYRLDASTGQALMTHEFPDVANAAVVHPVSSKFVVSTGGGDLACFNPTTFEIEILLTTTLYAKSILWSADGRWLYNGDERGRIGIFDSNTFEKINFVLAEGGPILRMFMSSGSTALYTSVDWGTQGRHSTKWKVVDKSLEKLQEYPSISLSYESDDRSLVVGMDWRKLVVAERLSGNVVRSEQISSGPLLSAKFESEDELVLALRHDRE